jgi:hypothetical protein
MQTRLIIPAFLTIALISLAFTGCTFKGSSIKGDGNITSESYSTGFFNSLEVAGMFNIVLEPGYEPGITIETDSNLHEFISFENRNQTLIVKFDLLERIRPTKINLYVVYPELEKITLGGACKISSPVLFKAYSLEYDISGAASIDMELEVDNLITRLAGAGSINLQGSALNHRLELSGASKLNARNLITRTTDVQLSGAGSANVHVSQELAASLSGIGSIKYYGDPAHTSFNKSGIGKITRGQ